MEKPVTLQVCKCCGISDAAVKAAVERMQAQYGGHLRVELKACLDVCQPEPAAALGGEVILVKNGDTSELERQVAARVAAGK